MDRDTNEKSVSSVSHEEGVAKHAHSEHEAAHRGALLEERERQMGYFSYMKYHWRPLLCCTQHCISIYFPSLANSIQAQLLSFQP